MLYLIAAVTYVAAVAIGYSYGYSAGLRSARLMIMRNYSLFNKNEPETEA